MVKIKGRKTTYEERIEIVEDCLKNGCNYSKTSLKYQISYGDAYQWVRKFRENGIAGLRDKRGRTKPAKELSEVERLRAENTLRRIPCFIVTGNINTHEKHSKRSWMRRE